MKSTTKINDQMADIKSLTDQKDLKDKVHELKTWTSYFLQVKYGFKTFEVRKNDRDFQVGDYVKLKEWDNETETYTGRFLHRQIDYILHGGQFGIEKGYVVMQLKEGIGPINIVCKY